MLYRRRLGLWEKRVFLFQSGERSRLLSVVLAAFFLAMALYTCEVCQFPCRTPWGLGGHMRTHRSELLRPAATPAAEPVKPLYDEYGRALFYFRHNTICEGCSLGGTVIPCSYCNLTWHQTCAGLASVPEKYFMCPGCVVAESEGQEMGERGRGQSQ